MNLQCLSTVNYNHRINIKVRQSYGCPLLNPTGTPKPAKEFEAHAIISGGSEYARSARILLARYGIRIDDPVNGVWLPNFKKHVPHSKMPKAHAHRTIHTPQYYINLLAVLDVAGSKDEVAKTLNKVRKRLIQGSFPYQKHSRINERNW